MNYTKGEWNSSHEQDGYTQILYSKGKGKEQLCSILWGMTIPKEQRDANGFLKAAAPEMYEALKELVEFDAVGGNGKDHWILINNAKRTLFKAEGGK